MFTSFQGHTQTLQFSQAVIVLQNQTDTVPADHIWKIEAWTLKGEMCGGVYSYPLYFNINGTAHYLQASFRDGNNYQYDGGSRTGAMWLPEGTIINIPNTGDCLRALFMLEFEIVP